MRKVLQSNIFFLFLIAMQIISFVIIALISAFTTIKLSTTALLFISSIVCIILPIVVFFLITRQPIKQTLKINKLNFKSVVFSIIIGFLFIPVGAFCSLLTSLWFDNNVVDVMNSISSTSAILFIILLSIMPAIGEELAVRGIILSGYEDISIHKSAFITALLFAILHLNPPQFLYAFLLGALLAYLVYYTNSIFSSIIVHFVFNGTNSLNFLIQSSTNAEALKSATSSMDITNTMLISSFILASICSIGIIMLLRKIKESNSNRNINIYSVSQSTDVTILKKPVSSITAYSPIIASIIVYIIFAFVL